MTATKHNTPAAMDAFYSGDLEDYHNGRAWFYALVAETASKATAGKGDLSVLDVGCGRGDQLRHLRAWFGARIHSARGIDISAQAVKLATLREPWAQFVVMDITRPRLDWGFDLIVCSQVLEHVLQTDRALDAMYAMLNRGGVLLLTVPDGRIDSYGGHYHFWTLDAFAELLRRFSGTAARLTEHHLAGEVRK